MNAAPDGPAPARGGTFYRAELDVLRFGAFLFVVIHHVSPGSAEGYARLGWLAPFIAGIVSAGGFGVALFFSLRSYLITELLIRE